MAVNANYAATPRIFAGLLSVANPNRDGTGTLVDLGAAGASGSRLEYAVLKALATTTAGMIRLFIHDGTNAWIIHEEPVQAIVPGADNPSWSRMVNLGGVNLPANWSLRACTHNAEQFEVIGFGGNF